jgi:hypothetical protein
MNEVIKDDGFYLFDCPHCQDKIMVDIKQLNCKIFRHGIYKKTYRQVDPHLKKEDCEYLVSNDEVYGCCKPFEIIEKNCKLYCIKCEYK